MEPVRETETLMEKQWNCSPPQPNIPSAHDVEGDELIIPAKKRLRGNRLEFDESEDAQIFFHSHSTNGAPSGANRQCGLPNGNIKWSLEGRNSASTGFTSLGRPVANDPGGRRKLANRLKSIMAKIKDPEDITSSDTLLAAMGFRDLERGPEQGEHDDHLDDHSNDHLIDSASSDAASSTAAGSSAAGTPKRSLEGAGAPPSAEYDSGACSMFDLFDPLQHPSNSRLLKSLGKDETWYDALPWWKRWLWFQFDFLTLILWLGAIVSLYSGLRMLGALFVIAALGWGTQMWRLAENGVALRSYAKHELRLEKCKGCVGMLVLLEFILLCILLRAAAVFFYG